MRFLITTHADPKYMPRQYISPDEIVAGPNYNTVWKDGKLRFAGMAPGQSDLFDLWKKIPEDQKPDVLLVHADSTYGCIPTNIPKGLPAFLIIGGCTHMLKKPLRGLVRYALEGGFTGVVVWNRQNAHFFKEAGIKHVFWMPGLIMGVPPVPQPAEKNVEVAFFGQIGQYHPRRIRLAKALKGSGLPFFCQPMPRVMGLERFASALIAWNASLNGEFNMRVFEASSNGAMLLTDKLKPQAGLELFYKDGHSMVTYSDEKELIEKATYYINHPQEAHEIGIRGKEVYDRYFSSEARARTFMAMLQGQPAEAAFLLGDEPRCRLSPAKNQQQMDRLVERLTFYEWLQEKNRLEESLEVDVATALDPLVLSDICDLSRISIHLSDSIEAERAQQLTGILNTLKIGITPGSVKDIKNSVLLADAGNLTEQLLTGVASGNYGAVKLEGLSPEQIDICTKMFKDLGLNAVDGVSGLYAREAFGNID